MFHRLRGKIGPCWGQASAGYGCGNMNMTELLGREGERFVHLWLMIRLHQISKRHDTFEAFLQSSGISKGTLWKLMRGEGNPTISLLQRIADSQQMSFIELLGLDPESVRKDLEKVGIDAEQLASFSKGEKRSRKTMARMLEKSGA